MRRSAIVFLTLFSLSAAAQAADLPVVKAATPPPPGPKFFAWAEGGWSSFKLPTVHGFDYISPGASGLLPAYFDIDQGWYGRGEVGFTGVQSLGLLNGVSVAARYRTGSGNVEKRGLSAISLAYLSSIFELASTGGSEFDLSFAGAEQEFSLFDVELRFKHSPAGLPGVTLNAEPFYGRLKHDVLAAIGTDVNFPPMAWRGAELDGKIFGLQAAIESQHQIAPGIGLRGRLSVGAYRVDADADFFLLDPGDVAAADSVSRKLSGLRAGAEIGADFALTPQIMLGVTAGVDYWSKMPFPVLTRNFGGGPIGPPIGIGEDRFTDYFVGARLTFATGNP